MRNLFRIISILALVFLSNAVAGQCDATVEWEFNPPPPENGFYPSGTTVELCISVSSVTITPVSAVNGFGLELPPGWDMESVDGTNAPEPCGTGQWLFLSSLTCSGIDYPPGFYHDGNFGGPIDGNPCNNFGEICFSEVNFCIEMTLESPAESGVEDGADIAPTLIIYPDGIVGSWAVESCVIPVTYPGDLFYYGCPVIESDPEEVIICDSNSICLSEFLNDTIQDGGEWGGPNNWVADDCATFDPETAWPGLYSYTYLNPAGCPIPTLLEVSYNEIVSPQTEYICDSEPFNLNEYEFNIELPDDGIWLYPDASPPTEVLDGVVDPAVDSDGGFIYRYSEEDCWVHQVFPFEFVDPDIDDDNPFFYVCNTTEPLDLNELELPIQGAHTGEWFRVQDDGFISISEGVIDPANFSNGIYRYDYAFGTSGSCPGELTIFVEFKVDSYSEIEVCGDTGEICLNELVSGNLPPDGYWSLLDTNGNLVEQFEESFELCIQGSEINEMLESYQSGFRFVYFGGLYSCGAYTYTLQFLPNGPFGTSCSQLFETLVSNECIPETAELNLYEPGTDVLIATYPSSGSTENGYLFEVQESGNYDIYISLFGFLVKKIEDQSISNESQADFGMLTRGDFDGDNSVGLPDFSLFASIYGSSAEDENFVSVADMNCDLQIGIADFTLFSSSYGQEGDSPF